jgi:galactose-1-phosphate uridylyltransferase
MQTIRQYATVHNNMLTLIHLPDEMNEMEVEITLTPKVNIQMTETKKGTGLSSLRGRMQSKMTNEEIDAQLKAMREEWERPLF